jgi:cytochrome subunit of sulfide dehydrogenase
MPTKVTILTLSRVFLRQLVFNNLHNQKTTISCTLLAALTLAIVSATPLFSSAAHSAETDLSKAQKHIHTRTLAASCAACHGTLGNSLGITPVLAGLDSTYFVNQMLAFRTGDRDSTVMHHHAQGLTIDEINALADYFSIQKRLASPAVMPQTLKARDE